MLHNDSHKYLYLSNGTENKSVMLSTLGATLGVWVSMVKENLTARRRNYNIVGKYGYEGYPANQTDLITIRRCYATQVVT
jgi:phosphoribosylformylglycinamidine synthase